MIVVALFEQGIKHLRSYVAKNTQKCNRQPLLKKGTFQSLSDPFRPRYAHSLALDDAGSIKDIPWDEPLSKSLLKLTTVVTCSALSAPVELILVPAVTAQKRCFANGCDPRRPDNGASSNLGWSANLQTPTLGQAVIETPTENNPRGHLLCDWTPGELI